MSGGYDPGWNDPPKFSYDQASAIQASALKKGNLLNKRVAYPLAGNSTNQQHVDPTVPPKMDINIPGPPRVQHVDGSLSMAYGSSPPVRGMHSVLSTNIETKTVSNLGKDEKLVKVIDNLKSVCSFEAESEICRRLAVMEKMWKEDKLNDSIQDRMLTLSEALVENEVDSADHIQKSLMVDYITMCSPWMSGIRQIILQSRPS